MELPVPMLPVGAWFLVQLVAAVSPGRASADQFVLPDPRVDPSWGRQPGQPIAPGTTRWAEEQLPNDVVGKARNAAYLAALRASPPTLDEAAAHHFYASVAAIPMRPDRPGFAPVLGAGEQAAVAGVLAAKAREAEPALAAELDARFAVLTAALERADAVTLPPAGAGAVTYCRWISAASGTRQSQLAVDLRRRCIADRDRFIGVLVLRLADLAVMPDLPSIDGAAPDAGKAPALGDLALPPAVLPGETLDPLPYAPLAEAFDTRLRARFEAARPRLETRLDQELARRAATDVVLPPTYDCTVLLGPYAGPLSRLPAAAGVAKALSRACLPEAERQVPITVERIRHEVLAGFDAELARVREAAPDASRIERTPEASCAMKLAPHFPAPVPHYDANAWPFAGLDAARSMALRQACVDAAAKVLRAVMDKHFALALADSTPDPDTLTGWEAHGWYAVPPGGTDWIGAQDDPFVTSSLRRKFQAEYDVAMGPRRKSAAARFATEIERGLAPVMTGGQPAASVACAGRGRPVSGLDALTGFKADPLAERRSLELLRSKPALSAYEAESLVTGTCRVQHDATAAILVGEAVTAAGVDPTFAGGERLAVPRHEDGRLLEVDPLALVRGAAADGIRVAFAPGGNFSNPSMSITPIAATSPQLDGTLREEMGDDGTKELVIRRLDPLPGLRTPEDTVTCLLTPVDQAAGEARANAFGAVAGAMLSYIPELHGSDVRDAMARGAAVEACRKAKAAFTGRAGAPVQ
jgi:hypothetical protein